MHYVYAFYNKRGNNFYIGYTENLERRIDEHEREANQTTSRFPARDLIFYEAFYSKEDAARRECYLKTTKGKRTLRLMLQCSLECLNDCPVV